MNDKTTTAARDDYAAAIAVRRAACDEHEAASRVFVAACAAERAAENAYKAAQAAAKEIELCAAFPQGGTGLALGCLCGRCDFGCQYALCRPCCGACVNGGRGADAGRAERDNAAHTA